jgi:hypothetical protein
VEHAGVTRRRCINKSCATEGGTFLSRYNFDDVCLPCQEKARSTGVVLELRSESNPNTALCQCGCGQETPIATVTRSIRGEVKGQPVRYVRGHQRARGVKLTPELVRTLRREYGEGGIISFRALGEKYGMREQTARDAINRITWAHVEDEEAA